MSFLVEPRSPAQAMRDLFEQTEIMRRSECDQEAEEHQGDRLKMARLWAEFDEAASQAMNAADELREADVLEEIDGFLTVLYDGVPK